MTVTNAIDRVYQMDDPGNDAITDTLLVQAISVFTGATAAATTTTSINITNTALETFLQVRLAANSEYGLQGGQVVNAVVDNKGQIIRDRRSEVQFARRRNGIDERRIEKLAKTATSDADRASIAPAAPKR